MFSRSCRAAAAAVLAFSLGAVAAHAAGPVYVTQASSPVWWSTTGDHADLVLRYSGHAGTTLAVNVTNVFDIGGANISEVLETCGSPVKTGDSVTSYQLSPGGLCFVRAYRSTYEIAARVVLSDNTGSSSNINDFVRTSLEVRDVNDNVLTHIDLH